MFKGPGEKAEGSYKRYLEVKRALGERLGRLNNFKVQGWGWGGMSCQKLSIPRSLEVISLSSLTEGKTSPERLRDKATALVMTELGTELRSPDSWPILVPQLTCPLHHQLYFIESNWHNQFPENQGILRLSLERE